MALPVMTFVGNAVSDPDLRFTQSGTAVCNFRVAANERKKQGDEWVDGASVFLSVSCWEQLAENVANSIRRGDGVIVVGPLEQEEYETREGEKRTVYKIRAYEVAASLRRATVKIEKLASRGPQTQERQGSSSSPKGGGRQESVWGAPAN
jgi:single-strand DNA-binding protein